MQRGLRMCCLLLAAAMLLCACSKNKDEETQAVPCIYWTVSETRAAEMQSLSEAYNAAHPDTPIALQTTVFRSDQIDVRLWTLLHSGVLERNDDVPDLVDVAYPDVEKYVSPLSCLLYPLDEMRAAAESAGVDGEIFEAFTYRNVCFGMPYGPGCMRLVFRAELLAEYGIAPEELKTWEELRVAGERYHAASGQYLLSVDMDDYLLFLTLLLQNAGTERISQTHYEQTLLQLQQMYRSGALTIMPGGRYDSKSFLQAFAAGEIACVLLPEPEVTNFMDLCGDVPALSSCAIPEQTVRIPTYAAAIPTAAKNYLAMQELLNFVVTADGSPLFVQTEHAEALPVRNAEQTGAYLSDYKLELARLLLQ